MHISPIHLSVPNLTPQDRPCEQGPLWAEHGWALTGRELTAVLAVIAAAATALALLG